MTNGIRLAAILAVLATVFATGGGAEAANRKAYNSLKAQAEAYCAEIKKNEVYECSVEKCPCTDGQRQIKRFDKLRTRAACVCTPDTGRKGMNLADATDFCVDWNLRNGSEDNRCFVVEGSGCPSGTSELNGFNRLRGHGPEHTACRGKPPEEEDESAEGETADSDG